VIVVGVRHDHVVDDDVAAVVLLDVLDHLLADTTTCSLYPV
jgi:hypothetical protein